jgi:hypothetical protein
VVAVLGLGIAGIVFFSFAVETMARPETRTPALVAGITCLVLATGILVLGVFSFRKRE